MVLEYVSYSISKLLLLSTAYFIILHLFMCKDFCPKSCFAVYAPSFRLRVILWIFLIQVVAKDFYFFMEFSVWFERYIY
jgi:hypothetical protein